MSVSFGSGVTSSSHLSFHFFTDLPNELLNYLLTSPCLDAFDLTSLYDAAVIFSPVLADAIESAAHSLLGRTAHGRYLLSHPMPRETPLCALRFLHSLDSPAPLLARTSLWTCGRNDWGQGARPSDYDVNELRPCYRVSSDTHDFTRPPAAIVVIAAGCAHSVCLTAAGALLVAGANSRGQLGLGDSVHRLAWAHVSDMKGERIAQVACGKAHTVLLTPEGTVYTTGANEFGQLALPETKDQHRFHAIPFASSVAMIAAGHAHTVCLMRDGTVCAAGDNSRGQLGARHRRGSYNSSLQPIDCFGRRVIRVACGNDTTMLLTADNMVLVSGKRKCGLSVIGGLGTSRVSHLVLGERFAVVRTREGDVALSKCRKRFIVLDEFQHISAQSVAAGHWHYTVLCDDGSVLAAGTNAFGQVAAGEMGLTFAGSPNAQIFRPHQVELSHVKIPDGYHALQVAAGTCHTLFLLAKME